MKLKPAIAASNQGSLALVTAAKPALDKRLKKLP
jgi:hypothetical protein